jgi:hypothetical protein
MEKKIMFKTVRTILLLPVLVLVIGLACQLSGGPTPPRNVPVSTEQSQSLNKTVQAAKPDPKSGKITISMTEAQITSYIVINLRENYQPILLNPVVIFQPDQVEIYGTIQGDSVSANGRVVCKVKIDSLGKPLVEITEANFGPIPVPAGLVNNLTVVVDKAIADSMKEYSSEYRLESITFNTATATLVIAKK